ncbi:Ropporin-1-like protein [Tetrabaena socialis]|uniref:Ropporin-1-like protein n=1 Tax=Tetrabaena socialis TaxID=47790 RepID=A0A2J7ZYC4_9CHLO|nr:Ropporin-1-like protein [Tetrabaena socialis]|eukprot:PNH05260.1 Ropporin-1-like protein [Tetrabaena socialis]
MDVEPIFCAEQIVIPHNLADILKAYTKEVIRRQPTDIVAFSAKYFTNLATVASGASNTTAPGKEQLRQVYTRGGSGGATLTQSQVNGLCQQAGIAEPVVAKVMEVGAFDAASLDLKKFVFLMLAMSCEDFNRVCMGVFDVFSDNGSLPTEQFIQLVGYLGPDMDPEVTPALLAAVEAELAGPSSVTYMEVCESPTLKPKLGLS